MELFKYTEYVRFDIVLFIISFISAVSNKIKLLATPGLDDGSWVFDISQIASNPELRLGYVEYIVVSCVGNNL
jgi:hypothetical protein